MTELCIQNGIPTHYFRIESKHTFQSTKKVNILWNITLYLHNSGGFRCVQLFYLSWYQVKTSAKHDRCGMKLCQNCQEFSWWEFLSETSLPTALLDVLLVIFSGQWAVIFKRYCNKGKRPSRSHSGEVFAIQGFYLTQPVSPQLCWEGSHQENSDGSMIWLSEIQSLSVQDDVLQSRLQK